MPNNKVHIPYLSEDEKLFLNTTATYSQSRRMHHHGVDHHYHSNSNSRASLESHTSSGQHPNRRHQVVSVSSLSFLWKRRGSSTSSLSLSPSADSMDFCEEEQSLQSPKARELESLIFDQPQRTVRLSLTPRCAV